MADASKLKGLRRSGLGSPPALDDARTDLAFPPARTTTQGDGFLGLAQTVSPLAAPERLDGRRMRRSGRTIQFATRVSPAFDERIRVIAQREGMLLVEVLEKALDAYERSRVER